MRAKLIESVRASGQYQPVLECAALLGEMFRVDDLRPAWAWIAWRCFKSFVISIRNCSSCATSLGPGMLCIFFDLSTGDRPRRVGRRRHEDAVETTGVKNRPRVSRSIAGVLERRKPQTLQLASTIAEHYSPLERRTLPAASTSACAAARARGRHAFDDARRFLAMANNQRDCGRSTNFAEERLLIESEEAQVAGRDESRNPPHRRIDLLNSCSLPGLRKAERGRGVFCFERQPT